MAGAASSGMPTVAGYPSAEEVAALIVVLLAKRRCAGPRRAAARPSWRPPSYAGSRSWRRPRGGWGSAL